MQTHTTHPGTHSPHGGASSGAGHFHALQAGDVALAKGERWLGNQGRGLVHRSPTPENGQSRLLLTLDWLA